MVNDLIDLGERYVSAANYANYANGAVRVIGVIRGHYPPLLPNDEKCGVTPRGHTVKNHLRLEVRSRTISLYRIRPVARRQGCTQDHHCVEH